MMTAEKIGCRCDCCEDARKAIAELTEALEDAEGTIRFAAFKDGFCEACREFKPSGLERGVHLPDCEIAATLKRIAKHRRPTGDDKP